MDAIRERLEGYRIHSRIPHILFHGQPGSGKRTLVYEFMTALYGPNPSTSQVKFVECAYGKGIRFVREELKIFARAHINSNSGATFKSVVLLNADKLTSDAQSALRRCIEINSHNTRFFMTVHDIDKLLLPIVSRFCDIYVPLPANGSWYQQQLAASYGEMCQPRGPALKRLMDTARAKGTDIQELAELMAEQAYCADDLAQLIESGEITGQWANKNGELLVQFECAKREFRNETLLIMYLLCAIEGDVGLKCALETVPFM